MYQSFSSKFTVSMFNWNRPCFVSSISLYWDIHFKVDVGLFKHLQIYNLFLIILLYRKLIFFTFVQKYIRHKECHRVHNRLLTCFNNNSYSGKKKKIRKQSELDTNQHNFIFKCNYVHKLKCIFIFSSKIWFIYFA